MISLRKLLLRKHNEMSWTEQKAVLRALPDPHDDIDRTYLHYQCVSANMGIIERITRNCLSIIAFPIFFIISLYNKAKTKCDAPTKTVLLQVDNPNGVIYPYEDFMPSEFDIEYPQLKHIHIDDFPNLNSVVFGIVACKTVWECIKRHPLQFYLNFLIFIHIFSLNGVAKKYNPDDIITYRVESDCTSSVNTFFCEALSKQYICFMHGDYLIQLKQCFFRYSRYYIWDESYLETFRLSRCADMPFEIVVPPSFKEFSLSKTPNTDVTYYFDGDHDNIERVKDILKTLVTRDYTCAVRPHPRFSDLKDISNQFSDILIEVQDVKNCSIKESIENTKYAIGISSTVLSQAYFAGCTIIIDDISDPNLYDELKERRSISIMRPHIKLSSFLNN